VITPAHPDCETLCNRLLDNCKQTPFVLCLLPFIRIILVPCQHPALKSPAINTTIIMINTMIKTRGLTMIELLVTLMVASILAALAAPSFREFTLNNRLTTSANTLVSHLAYARSEAIRLNQAVN